MSQTEESMRIHGTKIATGALVLLAAICTTACGVDSTATSEDVVVEAILPPLEPQGLSQNGISQKGISMTGLAKLGLADRAIGENSLATNANFEAYFRSDPTNAGALLGYVARCALDGSEKLAYAGPDGSRHIYDGNLGLAREWLRGPIERVARERVSGCLMAHVNAAGRHVIISVRGTSASLVASTTAEEARDYAAREGAFFGNVFSTPQTMHVCSDDAARQRLLYSSNGRICTTPGGCGFVWDGPCSRVCSEAKLATSDQRTQTYSVYARCAGFESPITTFLAPPTSP